MSPLRLVNSDDPRHTFVLHLLLFVVINVAYLVLVGWRWLWVVGIWSVGLAVHAAIALRAARRGRTSAAAPAEEVE